jgi:membrane-bound lytic murein transglycosylase F
MFRGWLLTIRAVVVVLLAGTVAAVNGCEGWNEQTSSPSTGTLRVVALKEPLSRVRPGEGLEHDLLWHFAESRQERLQWKWVSNPEEALEYLQKGKADIAAGRWSAEPFERNTSVLTGPAYEEALAVLVCQKDLRSESENSFLQNWFSRNDPKALAWIERQPLRIAVHRRDLMSGFDLELLKINPEWKVRPAVQSPLVLAKQIAQKKLDCFVTDATTGQWIQNLRPSVRVAREVNLRLSKAFLFSPDNRDLEMSFTSWFQRHNRQGHLTRVRQRYLGFQNSLTDLDRQRLHRARAVELPHLIGKFQKFAKEFQIPWELLAAVAYQESHWNNDAQSHTGVRGIMQLTQETARHLGVEDREDLEQSLWGGAKYLRALIDQQPKNLHPRERLALALAAYNVGWGHLRDAQKLAANAGRSPFSFWELRTILPLLSDPAIAADLEFGEARGDEPVQFTERVLAFYDILSDRSDVP